MIRYWSAGESTLCGRTLEKRSKEVRGTKGGGCRSNGSREALLLTGRLIRSRHKVASRSYFPFLTTRSSLLTKCDWYLLQTLRTNTQGTVERPCRITAVSLAVVSNRVARLGSICIASRGIGVRSYSNLSVLINACYEFRKPCQSLFSKSQQILLKLYICSEAVYVNYYFVS